MTAPIAAWSPPSCLRLGLAEVVQQRRRAAPPAARPHRPAAWTTAKTCSSSDRCWKLAPLVVADRRTELGHDVDEDAGVPRQPQRFCRVGAEQELGELAHPVRGQPAADPLAGDVVDPRRPLAHLAQRVLVGVDVELRDEAEAADDAERVVAEARRPGRAQNPLLEVGAAAERVEDLSRLEAARDRVDREVAPRHVLLEGDLAVGDDLEVVPARAGRAFDARRRELDSGGLERPRRLVPRQQPDADALVGDDRDPRPCRTARAPPSARHGPRPGRRSRAPAASARAARRGRRRRRDRRRARASARSRRPSPTSAVA